MNEQQLPNVVAPAAEVVIRIHGDELVVIGFFPEDTGHTDVLVGIADPTQREICVDLLEDAKRALDSANWLSVSELDQILDQSVADFFNETSSDEQQPF